MAVQGLRSTGRRWGGAVKFIRSISMTTVVSWSNGVTNGVWCLSERKDTEEHEDDKGAYQDLLGCSSPCV